MIAAEQSAGDPLAKHGVRGRHLSEQAGHTNARLGPGVGTTSGRGAATPPPAYLADFSEVRRQRVQTSAFVATPLASRVVKGWRFGW